MSYFLQNLKSSVSSWTKSNPPASYSDLESAPGKRASTILDSPTTQEKTSSPAKGTSKFNPSLPKGSTSPPPLDTITENQDPVDASRFEQNETPALATQIANNRSRDSWHSAFSGRSSVDSDLESISWYSISSKRSAPQSPHLASVSQLDNQDTASDFSRANGPALIPASNYSTSPLLRPTSPSFVNGNVPSGLSYGIGNTSGWELCDHKPLTPTFAVTEGRALHSLLSLQVPQDSVSESSRSKEQLNAIPEIHVTNDAGLSAPPPPSWDPSNNESPSPVGAMISSIMPPSEIIAHLGDHNCPDLTAQIDHEKTVNLPVAGGGFSDVYKGQLQDGTAVAIKCLRIYDSSTDKCHKNPKHTARELYAWSRFKHENVVQLLGLAMFNNQLAMMSPWMENGNVVAYLRRCPQADRLLLSRQVVEGLAYLHGLGSVHGDIKGLNVLIDNNGVAKLTDFGNVILTAYSLRFTVTKTKASHSLRWTAPELFDDCDCSMPADIYALGMVGQTILEIITGKPPFDGRKDNAVLAAVMMRKEHPSLPKELTAADGKQGSALWELLTRCWSFEQGMRPCAMEVKKIMNTITRTELEHQI